MKRNQVDLLFYDSAKKRRVIITYTVSLVLLTALLIYLIFVYVEKSKVEYAKYTENSKVDYQVYLKENEFFPNTYAESEKQYIASLIDYINTTFEYNVAVDKKNVDFKYSYYIDAVVDVKDRSTDKSLYSFSEKLVDVINDESNGQSTINIKKSAKVDYNKYNDVIESLIDVYKLNNVNSTLTVNMHVETLGSCDEFNDQSNESVVSLVIPLTAKTIAIDIANNLVDNVDKIVICSDNSLKIIYIAPPIVIFVLEILVIILFARFVITNRTAKDIYRIKLKKIVSNYHAYIQKINNGFDLRGYKLVAVDTFNDILEIRDTVQQPILMVESKTKNGVHFIIPSNTKLLYVYTLKELEDDEELESTKRTYKKRTKKEEE